MRFSAVAVAAALALPPTLPAQNWSAAEQEVLQALEACMQAVADQNVQTAEACTDDEFVGWRYDMPGTRGKTFSLREWAYSRAAGETLVTWAIEPLSVRIYGSVAIVHYYHYQAIRSKDGTDRWERYRWTDLLLKRGNRWAWIADHGGIDPGNAPVGK